MDLKTKKYKIIEALLKVEEPSIINHLESILKIKSEDQLRDDELMEEAEADIKAGRTYSINDAKKMVEKDEWNYEISETEKLFIEAGLKDIESGNTVTNEEVIREINEKYGL